MDMHPLCLALAISAAVAAGPPSVKLPAVVDVQRRATAHAKLDLAEVARWKKKARLAALVPKVQLDYGHRFRNDVDIDIDDNVYVGSSGIVVGPEDGGYSRGQTADHNIGFRAVWELSEVVFNPRQLSISAEMRRVAATRGQLTAEVARHYYIVEGCAEELAIMRRMKAEAQNPAKVAHGMFLRRVACRESQAALDGLTGGWFSGQVEGDPCS